MSVKFPISPLQAAQIDQQATVYKYGLKGATDPAPEGGGVIIEAATNKTVNGLQVPALTDDQLLAIYNATVAGKAVTITDATGMMHFSGVTADMVSDEVFVSFVYFDVMVLEYGEGDATTFKAIGGGHLFQHTIMVIAGESGGQYHNGTLDIYTNSAEAILTDTRTQEIATRSFGRWLTNHGYISSNVGSSMALTFNTANTADYEIDEPGCRLSADSRDYSVNATRLSSGSYPFVRVNSKERVTQII